MLSERRHADQSLLANIGIAALVRNFFGHALVAVKRGGFSLVQVFAAGRLRLKRFQNTGL